MKLQVGDLVRVRVWRGHDHSTPHLRHKQVGVVTAHESAEGNLLESVMVFWSDGSHEIDFPDWLEIVEKAP